MTRLPIFWALLFSLCSGELPASPDLDPERFDDSALRGELGEPLPFEVSRVFPEQNFRDPVEWIEEPGSGRIVICQVGGEIYRFDPKRPGDGRELLLDLRREIPEVSQLYGMAFHPRHLENRLVYLCYVLAGEDPDGSRVIECRLDADSGKLDLRTSRAVLTWLAGGHNGGSLQFGPDGYLYISTGDGKGPNPPDALGAGQDCSNLLSSILRIDVDRRDPGLPYAIPPDNPFSDMADVRPEIWSYGYRNPWRMSFDRHTGELWVGDVGWDTWEMIFYVRRGANFGWSVMEGRQPINVTWQRGPTPIEPPAAEHPHSEARSITGGYVYHGTRFPELKEAYVYGDYETGKIWALRHDRGVRTSLEEIADTDLRIICFGQTSDGEVYVVDYGGGIYHLQRRAKVSSEGGRIPEKLSATGLFEWPDGPRAELGAVAGLVEYEIAQPMWSDGLVSRRWLALPRGKVRLDRRRSAFPEGAVLVKTLSEPETGRRVETQILQTSGGFWRAFSYAWSADGSDAELVPAEGARTLVTGEGGSGRPWHFVSRADCLACHHAHAGGALGFSAWQVAPSSLPALVDAGYLEARESHSLPESPHLPLVAEEESGGVASRARAYLDVNCAPCHRENGGGLVPMELERHLPLERLGALDVRPQRGEFGIRGARLIAPGRPERSVLLYRMAKLGSGRMPHLGSQVVDRHGVDLIHRWIEDLDPEADRSLGEDEVVSRALVTLQEKGRDAIPEAHRRDPSVADLFREIETESGTIVEGPADEGGESDRILALEGSAMRGRELLLGPRGAICLTCHQLGAMGQAVGPALDALGKGRTREHLLSSLLDPSREVAPEYLHYEVTTEGGAVHAGFIRHHGTRVLILKNAALEKVEIPVEEVATMTVSDQSIMPAGLAGAFTRQEVADLLAYLELVVR